MKYSELLEKSPIRSILNSAHETIFEINQIDQEIDSRGVRGLAEDIHKTLKHIDEESCHKLRIAVVGELKTGKSTLINALLGIQVAYTDVTEATAVISEITYKEQVQIQIQMKSGLKKEIESFEELIEWMQKNSSSQEQISEVDRVRIGIPENFLKSLVLVDTPGLLTITEENETTTKEYIYQADYIMWIMNSNNLGDSSVNDAISRVATYGKPMIGVINKVHNQEERESIEDYIYDLYDGVFEENFFVSARNGWRARIAQKQEEWETSGIPQLLEFLEFIGSKSDTNKQRSNKDAVIYQLKREADFHKKLLISLQQSKQQYDSDMNILRSLRIRSKEKVLEELKYWLTQTVFRQERQKLLSLREQEFWEEMKLYSSSEYVAEMIQQKYQEIADYIYTEWRMVQTQLVTKKDVENENSGFEGFYTDNVDETTRTEIVQSTSRYSDPKEGVKFGVKLGALIAGYTAWLGPAAAYITIGSAMITWVPVLAAGGFVVSKFMTGSKTQQIEQIAMTRDEKVTRLQKDIVSYIKQEVIHEMKHMLDSVIDHCYRRQLQFITDIVKQHHFNYNEPDYSVFVHEVEDYIDFIETVCRELEESNESTFAEEDYL